MKNFIALLSLGVIVALSFFETETILWSVAVLNFKWSIAFWVPKILIVLITLLITKIFPYQLFSVKFKSSLVFLIIVTCIGISFAIAPIYIEDLNQTGQKVSSENYLDNQTIKSINSLYPNFDGLIVISSTSCPHCKLAAKKLNILKKGNPDRDVLFVMFTLQEQLLAEFKTETNATELDYMLAPDETGTLAICQGRFPTFAYLKDGKIIHQWTNNELGYPAYDWIENGLK